MSTASILPAIVPSAGAPLAEMSNTTWIIIGLVIALAVIGLVIYISYKSTLDEDSRDTEP